MTQCPINLTSFYLRYVFESSTMAAWPMTVFFYFLDIESHHWISNSRNPYLTDILSQAHQAPSIIIFRTSQWMFYSYHPNLLHYSLFLICVPFPFLFSFQ